MSDTSPAPAAADETSKAASPTPIFGSGSAFGTGTGFAGFTGVDSSKTSAATPEAAGEEGEEGAPDEDCSAEFKPVVQLQEVETTTGEEAENQLLEFKCKLYRFDNESSEWKERGVGHIKLLEHKQNNKIRLLMRQEKTLKIRANHIVMPGTKLQEHSGSEKAWVWSAVDFAEEKQSVELFCVRFASAERAQEFKKKFEEAMDANEKLLAADEAEQGTAEELDTKQDADDLADQLGKQAAVEDAPAAEEEKQQEA